MKTDNRKFRVELVESEEPLNLRLLSELVAEKIARGAIKIGQKK